MLSSIPSSMVGGCGGRPQPSKWRRSGIQSRANIHIAAIGGALCRRGRPVTRVRTSASSSPDRKSPMRLIRRPRNRPESANARAAKRPMSRHAAYGILASLSAWPVMTPLLHWQELPADLVHERSRTDEGVRHVLLRDVGLGLELDPDGVGSSPNEKARTLRPCSFLLTSTPRGRSTVPASDSSRSEPSTTSVIMSLGCRASTTSGRRPDWMPGKASGLLR